MAEDVQDASGYEGPEEVVFLAITRAQAAAVRDLAAHVSGNGPRREVIDSVFLLLEKNIGYDPLVSDQLSGEVEAV